MKPFRSASCGPSISLSRHPTNKNDPNEFFYNIDYDRSIYQFYSLATTTTSSVYGICAKSTSIAQMNRLDRA